MLGDFNTLPETNIVSENQWLEDEFPFMPQTLPFLESPSNEHRTAAESASAETGAGGGGGTGNGGASSLLLPLEPAGWRNGTRRVEV